MGIYVILSRFAPDAFKNPADIKQAAKEVKDRIKKECPGIEWKDSYAMLGRFDVIDVVKANTPEEVERAAMIIRSYGHSTTETLGATPWKDFLSRL